MQTEISGKFLLHIFTLRISSSVSFFNCRKDQSFRIFFYCHVVFTITGGFVISGFFSIHFTIIGLKNMVRYTGASFSLCRGYRIAISASGGGTQFSLGA